MCRLVLIVCIYIILFWITLQAMELDTEDSCEANNLPDELLVHILYNIIPVCHNFDTAFKTVTALQQTNRKWYAIANDKQCTLVVIHQAADKFFPFDISTTTTGTNKLFYGLLHINKTARFFHENSCKALQSIIKYAIMHHNELSRIKENECIPWKDLSFGGFSNALRRSYNHLQEEHAKGNYEAIEKTIGEITTHFNNNTQLTIKNAYPAKRDPHLITAQLIYFLECTPEIIKNIFKKLGYTEQSVTFFALFSGHFDNPCMWQPASKIIAFDFKDETIKNRFMQKSKILFNFT